MNGVLRVGGFPQWLSGRGFKWCHLLCEQIQNHFLRYFYFYLQLCFQFIPLCEFIISCNWWSEALYRTATRPHETKPFEPQVICIYFKNLYLSKSKRRQLILFLHLDERSDREKWKIWPGWVVITVAEEKVVAVVVLVIFVLVIFGRDESWSRWQRPNLSTRKSDGRKLGTKTCHHKLKHQSQ